MPRRLMHPAVLMLVLISLAGCASLRPALPPLSSLEIEGVLGRMEEQRDRVSTFFSLGTVILKKWIVESDEAKILVVGCRDPLRIKVEITHPWGAPVLHILVDRGRLEAFSFVDATLYTGPATPETMDRFMPSPPDLRTAWSLLRGYPAPHISGDVIPEDDRLLACGKGCADPPWTLRVASGTMNPERLTYPGSGLDVEFSDLQEAGGIRYAGKVCYRSGEKGGTVVIRNERMVFNREIPETVFLLRKPGDYRTIPLDREAP